MSGYMVSAIAQHGVLEPGVHFTQKPFPIHAFTQRVPEVLDG
jgi:hypothetical protein